MYSPVEQTRPPFRIQRSMFDVRTSSLGSALPSTALGAGSTLSTPFDCAQGTQNPALPSTALRAGSTLSTQHVARALSTLRIPVHRSSFPLHRSGLSSFVPFWPLSKRIQRPSDRPRPFGSPTQAGEVADARRVLCDVHVRLPKQSVMGDSTWIQDYFSRGRRFVGGARLLANASRTVTLEYRRAG